MNSFIYTPKGYVNLNQVEMAEHTKGTEYKIIIDGNVIDDKNDFGNTIISMVPVQGDWECLLPVENEDGAVEAESFPVIAWGLTVLGFSIPVTPFDMGGAEGAYALRKKLDDHRIFDQFGQEYRDVDEWVESLTEHNNTLQAVK